MFEVIKGSEVWRDQAGCSSMAHTALSPPRPGFDETYARHAYEVRMSTNSVAEDKPTTVSLLGMTNVGHGLSIAALGVPA